MEDRTLAILSCHTKVAQADVTPFDSYVVISPNVVTRGKRGATESMTMHGHSVTHTARPRVRELKQLT
jgi:hypothetical protein